MFFIKILLFIFVNIIKIYVNYLKTIREYFEKDFD